MWPAGKVRRPRRLMAFFFSFIFIFSIIVFALTAGTVSVISRLFSSSARDDLNIAVDTSLISAIAADTF